MPLKYIGYAKIGRSGSFLDLSIYTNSLGNILIVPTGRYWAESGIVLQDGKPVEIKEISC